MDDRGHAQGSFSSASEPEAVGGGAGVARRPPAGEDYDVAIVGASLAGCAAAIMLGRAGARVALLEKSPDASNFKRICSHYIQSSAVGTLERLELLKPMVKAGAVRSRLRIWTRWGWIEPPAHSTLPSGVNMRRSGLDPLIRAMAAETPGVELLLGRTAQELVHEDGAVRGLRARGRDGETVQLRTRLVVGADGRGSRVAELAGVRTRTVPHGRIAYGGYFEGPQPHGAPDGSIWMLDPHWVAAFPTDSDLTFYACMPTKERLPEFRADPRAALEGMAGSVPDAPPIQAARLVEPVMGKVDMTNVAHTPAAPGLALVGDAALAIDPLWGVGCGWALQSSEWLADSVIPALLGSEPLERGLRRYRRRHSRALRGHISMINDYAQGRKLNAAERLLFSTAVRDQRVAQSFEAFGTRTIGPARMMAGAFPRALALNARDSLARLARARAGQAGLGSA